MINQLKQSKMKKFPRAEVGSKLFAALKKKYVRLSMAEEALGSDNKGNLYKVVNGIAIKL